VPAVRKQWATNTVALKSRCTSVARMMLVRADVGGVTKSGVYVLQICMVEDAFPTLIRSDSAAAPIAGLDKAVPYIVDEIDRLGRGAQGIDEKPTRRASYYTNTNINPTPPHRPSTTVNAHVVQERRLSFWAVAGSEV